MNRRQANQLRGKIRQYAGEKAYARCSERQAHLRQVGELVLVQAVSV